MIESEQEPSSYHCPEDHVLKRFLEFDDLMLGEHHGTTETPAFLKCLVDYGVINTQERLIVSLEMPSSAREPMSGFWQDDNRRDGRSSKAMYDLVRHLVELENKLLIDLHFQHRTRYFETDEALQEFLKNREKTIGVEIRELSEKGKVIVLAGNIHTLKFKPRGWEFVLEFEGKYVGPSFTHIIIESANGGATWSCQPECGIHDHSKQQGSVRGSFSDGKERGHDYIYYLDIDGFMAFEAVQ